ncbi:hypothetical protein B0T21DRAFT_399490 [Apiosordaria backusii]|uniref:Uncharacterized protein n=1 Tax=Apiosordaria backusii TaxID=314023 RepID=A0AA40K486_9PEZI|nr:hypothetical protein B0T21DRAFT_399490 [Apiosordaria backusii]
MRPLPLPLWALISAHLAASEQSPLLPTAIRKMPPNSNAKFHAHYCAFDPSHLSSSDISSSNHTLSQRDESHFSAPLRAVYNPPPTSPNPQRRGGVLLSKRQWSCPTDTLSCSSIGYPNTCCYEGSTCIQVPDTGLGPVGCCPRGTECTGGVTSCGEGGRKRRHNLHPHPHPNHILPLEPTTPTSTSTPISTSTSTPPPTTTTTQPISSSSSTTPESSTTDQPNEPGYCPTGFYACLARENQSEGCCQIGRDCASTDCPPLTSSTTVVDGNGVTVVVPMPTGAPPVVGGGNDCANGWFLCGRDKGEGCCPDGYGCGVASCTLVRAGETAGVAKAVPGESKAGRKGVVMGMGLGFMGGLVMAVL